LNLKWKRDQPALIVEKRKKKIYGKVFGRSHQEIEKKGLTPEKRREKKTKSVRIANLRKKKEEEGNVMAYGGMGYPKEMETYTELKRRRGNLSSM